MSFRKARRIVEVVADYFGFESSDLIGNSGQSKTRSNARHIAMYLVYHDAGLSYPECGEIFNCDSTTVQHGVKRIRKMEGKG